MTSVPSRHEHDPGAPGARPERLVVVAGTGTEVGKTWVAARVLQELRAGGTTVAARKPAQSFDPGDPETDAHLLGAASGEDPTSVCPPHRWYEVPMAPPMAAEVLGRPAFTIADLVAEIHWQWPSPRVAVVETAGGVRSPLAVDGDSITLVEALRPDVVVVVADAGLGTINAVRLTVEALERGAHQARLIVHLNRFDEHVELHRRNRRWLADRAGSEVVTGIGELAARLA
ncbi:ATP-dependent dethiobiotin synthetase BioD [Rhabdothermincola sediminis]|uniref:ATP-dependent dethiobiotin synthetase BioD n=1 Tax=Rhabdothermincola sediminis TaxID=2751370 RepID=UPI001AA014B0|nr:dethiobiotin synthase [Rhabdothermincola sediminis]